MIEQQIQIVVVAVDGHALLPLDEAEAASEFAQKTSHVTQDGGFQITLAVTVFQIQKVEFEWVFEWDQISAMKCVQLNCRISDTTIFFVGENLGKLDHALQVLDRKTLPVIGHQLRRRK